MSLDMSVVGPLYFPYGGSMVKLQKSKRDLSGVRYAKCELCVDLTKVGSPRVPIGILAELYSNDGFVLFGLGRPLLSELDLKGAGETWMRVFRSKAPGSPHWPVFGTTHFLEHSLMQAATTETVRDKEFSCLERIARMHTYSALQIFEGGDVPANVLESVWFAHTSIWNIGTTHIRKLLEHFSEDGFLQDKVSS